MNFSAYQCGILQAKAYRLLRSSFAVALEPYEITVAEWSLLVLLQKENGMRHSQIATILQVEAPLVTALVKQLERKRYIRRAEDPHDSRAKRLYLTKRGTDILPQLEVAACANMQSILGNISDDDLRGYFVVLEAITLQHASGNSE